MLIVERMVPEQKNDYILTITLSALTVGGEIKNIGRREILLTDVADRIATRNRIGDLIMAEATRGVVGGLSNSKAFRDVKVSIRLEGEVRPVTIVATVGD